ncbi:MAG: AlpA family phage regulatory protein [Thiobacillus sp.]
MKRGMQIAGTTDAAIDKAPEKVVVGAGKENHPMDHGKQIRDAVRARQPVGSFDARAIRELTQTARVDPTTLRRTIRRNELRQMVPLADSTIYELERRGEFPQRFFLTARCVVWDLAEIAEWLRSRRQPGDNGVKKAPMPDFRLRKQRSRSGDE